MKLQRSVLVGSLLALSSAGFTQTYHLTDLGTLGGTDSHAYAINSFGEVVGQAGDINGQQRAFLYSNGPMQDLGTLGGGESFAWGINDANQIVGTADLSTNTQHAFLYDGTMHDLGTLYGVSEAMGLNNLGQVVGFYFATDGTDHAFLYSDGAMTDLGLGPSAAYAMNDSGQIVGRASGAFVMTGGTTTFLPGGLVAYATNRFGHAAGLATNGSFLYDGSTMHFIGGFTATGLNDSDVIVGSGDVGGALHGFVHSGASTQDLNTVLDSSGTGWTVDDAHAVNNSGWIAATGHTSSGYPHALVLVPVPEPAAILALSAGVVFLIKGRRR
ncbi:MAG TPA: PEP-CTERM sorting domain-containing protein [Fimbriimonadaceae bacterium]|nr:PEP-CTERM sorting domain-containing protein [Fimbriimonadaceae bacterium]